MFVKERMKMKVSYHGHSVVKVETDKHTILIDPFISGNEACDLDAETVKADVILLTHGHNDHVGDTMEIAKRNDALVVAPNELAVYLGFQGLNTHPMHIGGAHEFDFGRVKFTQAFHGSSYTEEDNTIVYTGMPAGILLTIDGKTIYHVGDTALFSDLKMIGDMNTIDLAFVPIGDNFTMGPEDALVATDWIRAKVVVPVHYDTFPVIKQDPEAFAKQVKMGEGKAMKIGEFLTL
jgi:L-ascorbate metabolism protein UlaG (beta-lactamase superfamily)